MFTGRGAEAFLLTISANGYISNRGIPLLFPAMIQLPFFKTGCAIGIGGTCWAGSEALLTLLVSLGFQAHRVTATMEIEPGATPNHGTIIVNCGGKSYLADTSILHQTPILLSEHNPGPLEKFSWSATLISKAAPWLIRWRPLHLPDGCLCRLSTGSASVADFMALNERTRRRGPFNFAAYARKNLGDRVIGLAYRHRVAIDRKGRMSRVQLERKERDSFLINEIGCSEEIVHLLPDDRPTPALPPSREEQ